jgi:hypothetical protein
MTGEVVLGEAVVTVEVQLSSEVELVAVITGVFFYCEFE